MVAREDAVNWYLSPLNYYTYQLQFSGDRYQLTASKEDKKRMIRNDALPTITSVIVSDLDLRDLYRNEFLTSLDDLVAEIKYQLNKNDGAAEIDDVVELMNECNASLTKWFNLIPEQDVQMAYNQLVKQS